MVTHQLNLAFRSIRRHLSSYTISAGGLFLGITVFILLLCYVYPFVTFDQVFLEHEQIVRLNTLIRNPQQSNKYAASSFKIGPDLASFSSGIERQVRVRHIGTSIELDQQVLDQATTLFVDSTFFDIFDYPTIRGSVDDFRKDPLGIVITREIAETYFRDREPIGATLNI